MLYRAQPDAAAPFDDRPNRAVTARSRSSKFALAGLERPAAPGYDAHANGLQHLNLRAPFTTFPTLCSVHTGAPASHWGRQRSERARRTARDRQKSSYRDHLPAWGDVSALRWVGMVMDVRFVFMLPAGVHMPTVRMIHPRMVVIVPVRGDQVLHLSARTALAVVREMDVLVIVHQRLVLVALQVRRHLYNTS